MEAEREQRIGQLQGFLKANYENDLSNYWLTLLSSKSWTQLFDRAYEMSTIVNYYHNLQQQIAANDKAIALEQTNIEQQQAQLQTTLASKEQTEQSVKTMAVSEQNTLDGLNQQQRTTLAAAGNAQSNIKRVQELIQEAAIEAQQKLYSSRSGGINGPVAANGSASAIVAYALSFVGTPYVWGGTSPYGWDCSGFVQYVYRHFGVNLYRVSEDQVTEGVPVSASNLQPGDLVFFHTEWNPNDASHVGIYIGGGKMVNAEAPGIGTIVDNVFDPSYWGPRFLGARRILK